MLVLGSLEKGGVVGAPKYDNTRDVDAGGAQLRNLPLHLRPGRGAYLNIKCSPLPLHSECEPAPEEQLKDYRDVQFDSWVALWLQMEYCGGVDHRGLPSTVTAASKLYIWRMKIGIWHSQRHTTEMRHQGNLSADDLAWLNWRTIATNKTHKDTLLSKGV